MNGRCVSKAVLAISEQGRLPIAKESESLVELYGGGGDGGLHEVRPANQMITQFLATPSSICFAPNEHLVIADSGTKSVLVYSLQEEPHFVSGIVFYWKNGNVVIERVTRARSRICSSRGLLAPFNVVAGPSPLSQLFVVLEGLIFVITMDWNTVELIDYQQLSSSRDWSCMQFKAKQQCSKASIVHDHADNHKVGGQNPLAVTTGQFCAMFYLVTERRKDKINYVCHKPLCRVGKMAGQVMTRAGGYAATVVVYVRLTDHSGRLMFHARYGNCSEGQRRNTIHAEYFMLMDEEKSGKLLSVFKNNMEETLSCT